MLLELRIENLLLIERAELRLAGGLNVITGETGAGKTVLANALDLLLGGRARSGIVRPGAGEAYVEGVFERPPQLPPELEERLPEGEPELALARRVSAEGRSRAYIGGRSASVSELGAAAGQLVSFYGQHEHRRLTLAAAQLEILDRFCGDAQRARRKEVARACAEVRALELELEELGAHAGARERELDLLEFELREIDDAAPSAEEEAALQEERTRLRNVGTLRDASLGAVEALAPESASGASDMLAGALGALEAGAGLDATLDQLAERLRALSYEAADVAGELRSYGSELDAPAGRLEQVEERLAAVERLKRKHGGSVESVLAHAERCRAQLEALSGTEEKLEQTSASLTRARAALEAGGAALSAARRKVAPRLSKAVCKELSQLAMEGAEFEVKLTARERPGPTGADAVEFMLAPNPGVPAAPLREIASGGELSRAMLALLGVADDGGVQTLVFDEIDAGIGGTTARVVGERLQRLAAGRQLLCITHLPQIASLAERHFRIAKDLGVSPARTDVVQLDESALVGELARMLGSDEGDRTARRHAQQLLRAA